MRTASGAVIAVLVVVGCGGGGKGGGGGTGGTTDRVCIPGMSVACACTNAAEGAQVCTADGAGYGACICDIGPGTAGTGGSAGTGGGAGTGGSAGTGGTGGSAGTGGTGGSAGTGGTGGTGGLAKSCTTWTTVSFADFNDGTLGGLRSDSTCFGCSAAGCATVVNQQLYMPSQWNLVCYPGLTATETRAIRISYDVTDAGTMGGMGWDNFAVNLKTGLGSAGCGDSSGSHNVIYAVPATTLLGHWELIRWGGNGFQFNHAGTRLGEIDCALPPLSAMAVDFHEGGPGVAQSKIDNFRVEVCTVSP